MRPFNRSVAITCISILITLAFLSLHLWSPGAVWELLESPLIDLRFQVKNVLNPQEVPDNIIIAAIDEESLKRHGRWPWSRKIQAELMRRILSGKPAVLAIDIFYAEPESRESDTALSKVFEAGGGKIVLAGAFDREGKDSPEEEIPEILFGSAISRINHQSKLEHAVEVTRFLSSPHVVHPSLLFGHVFDPPDRDGKIRQEYLYVKYREDYYPSLSLTASAISLNKGISDITIDGGRGVSLGDIFIPTDLSGKIGVNYLGKEKTFRYVSVAEILEQGFDSSLFTDKIILLGTSALATYDMKATPFSPNVPGVEKNATVIENIINQRFLGDAPLLSESLIILLSGVFLSLLLPKIRALLGILISLALIVIFVFVNQFLFTYHDININFVYPFSNLMVIFILSITSKYLAEEKKARYLKRIFSHYVSPKIISELMRNPGDAKLEGQKKTVTVLFCDIRGFTSFSENREPEDVVARLNDYFTEMAEIIFTWDGTLDKFIGDGILAFWGAPADQPDHARRALMCAFEMSKKLDELRLRWKAEGKETFDFGVGINSGSVLVGNIGSPNRKMDYTVIGDHVNLAAKVSELTRDFDVRILFTEFTRGLLENITEDGTKEPQEIDEIGTVSIKGREKPVRVFQLQTHSRTVKPSEPAPL